MKKSILFVLLLLTSHFMNAQKESLYKMELAKDSIAIQLMNEVRQIHHSESFVLFLMNHAARYEDFDSLYTLLEDKPCPLNYTQQLVNGDSATIMDASPTFLFLVTRNFMHPFEMDQSKLKSIADLPAADCFYNSLSSAYNLIRLEIKNKLKISIDSIEVQKVLIPFHTNGYIQIKNNIRSWGNVMFGKGKSYLNNLPFSDDEKLIDFKLKKGLSIYLVRQINKVWENRFWSKINEQDESFMENDLGGSLIAKNISKYISAQVFNDIGFICINKRIVFIDLNK